MRKKIHPKYKPVTITCACGASFQTMSTRDSYSVDVCSSCHPFYTGDQKFIDTAGRVEKFQARFKNWDAEKTAAAAKATCGWETSSPTWEAGTSWKKIRAGEQAVTLYTSSFPVLKCPLTCRSSTRGSTRRPTATARAG